MQVTILGGGAIGSLLSARLARSGCSVSLLVRDIASPQSNQGQIRLIDDAGDHAIAVRIESQAATLGVQDVVVLAVKAHAIAGTLDQLRPLLGPDTIVLTAVNGVPWWFFEEQELSPPSGWLASVDPLGTIAAALKHQPLVGCVLFPAAQMMAPGTVRHISGNRIVFGAPSGDGNCAGAVAHLFANAGFEAPVTPNIRAALWAKLVGNAAVNPLSVITGATIKHIAEDPDLSSMLISAMREIDAVGASISIAPMMGMDDRLALAASVGDHKTSMLQDFEAGRPLELSPLLGAVREIAQWRGVATPILDSFDQRIAARLSKPVSQN